MAQNQVTKFSFSGGRFYFLTAYSSSFQIEIIGNGTKKLAQFFVVRVIYLKRSKLNIIYSGTQLIT